MNDHDNGVAELLHNATEDLDVPAADIVTRSIARGRVSRRRHLTGTTVATAVVIGVIGVGVTVVPDLLGDDGPRGANVEIMPADDGAPSDLPKQQETGQNVIPTRPPAGARELTLPADEIPAAIRGLLGEGAAGPLRKELGFEDQPHRKVVHFMWDGTFTSVIVEPTVIEQGSECRMASWSDEGTCVPDGPTAKIGGGYENTADQVTARSAVAWTGDGWRITVISYNAAEGKDVAPLYDEPPLSRAELEQVAASDIWFR